MPDTIPVDKPTVAIAGALLVHVPPPASLSVIVPPIHTDDGPEIGGGPDVTVIVCVLTQPVPVA